MADWETIRRRAWAFYGVVREIDQERLRQDEQWGGPEHDDQHTIADWEGFILVQVRRLSAAYVANYPAREHLVKIAALAVAAIESLDRQALKETDHAG